MLGLIIGTALGWSNVATIVLAIVLAFFFGYLLTMLPLLRAGVALGVTDALFWGSLVAALVLAGAVAFPVNRWLIARGKGHAVVHQHHHAHGS